MEAIAKREIEGLRALTFRAPESVIAKVRELARITLLSPSMQVANLVERSLWSDCQVLRSALPEDSRGVLNLKLPEALVGRIEARLARSGRKTLNAELTFLVAAELELLAGDVNFGTREMSV